MGDETKLEQLKSKFLEDLEKEALGSCSELQLQFIKCLNESIFNQCWHLQVKFQDCAKKRLEELKAENKEILEFKIETEKPSGNL